MNRYWMSWICYDEDYRPLTYPPNESIKGWWCSGYDSKENVILCGLIDAKSEDAAWSAIEKDWPGIKQRFCESKDKKFRPGDRFPPSAWMTERMEA